MNDKILSFWNQRAKTKSLPGSNDKILYEYEKSYLASLLKKNKIILDVGCGDGHLLNFLHQKKIAKKSIGVDFSFDMIKKAKMRGLKNTKFYCLDMKKINNLKKITKLKFDYIITLRSIINVKNTNKQKKIVESFAQFLKSNGKILCCEPSKLANEKINLKRKKFGLKEICAPWHNLFTDDKSFIKQKKIKIVKIHNFTGTYYFMSRIINAVVNKVGKTEPKNNDKINKIAMTLDQSVFSEYSREKIYEFKIK